MLCCSPNECPGETVGISVPSRLPQDSHFLPAVISLLLFSSLARLVLHRHPPSLTPLGVGTLCSHFACTDNLMILVDTPAPASGLPLRGLIPPGVLLWTCVLPTACLRRPHSRLSVCSNQRAPCFRHFY